LKEEINLCIGQLTNISLESRGSLGLMLYYEIDLPLLIEIDRLPESGQNIQPGDPINAVFSIKALNVGICAITFYETQPWNKAFTPILKRAIQINIEK
jgi:hypothetical protein